MESLRQEVNRLKCEKLDLLKQNVVSVSQIIYKYVIDQLHQNLVVV